MVYWDMECPGKYTAYCDMEYIGMRRVLRVLGCWAWASAIAQHVYGS